MEILLTEEEIRNIVASQSLEDIKLNSSGQFKKWDVRKVEDGYALEYIFDEKGNLKDKFKGSEKEGNKK